MGNLNIFTANLTRGLAKKEDPGIILLSFYN